MIHEGKQRTNRTNAKEGLWRAKDKRQSGGSGESLSLVSPGWVLQNSRFCSVEVKRCVWGGTSMEILHWFVIMTIVKVSSGRAGIKARLRGRRVLWLEARLTFQHCEGEQDWKFAVAPHAPPSTPASLPPSAECLQYCEDIRTHNRLSAKTKQQDQQYLKRTRTTSFTKKLLKVRLT